jgi:signal transduction histidine kinase
MEQTILKLENVLDNLLLVTMNRNSEVKRERIDFDDMLKEITHYCQQIKGFQRVDLKIVNQGTVPFCSDAERVKAVLQHLLANSITFQNFAQQAPFVRLQIHTTPQQAVIVIQDNGVGIPPESLPTVFDMFSRSSTQSSGPGLGLYLVKEVLDQLSGNIQVRSLKGQGTVFTVEIPNQALLP